MKRKQDLNKVWRELCAGLDADDGVTTDELKRQHSRSHQHSGPKPANKSTLRLCAQVGKAIDLALSADFGDEDMQALRVAHVEPYPDARRLRVHLCPSAEVRTPDYASLNAKVQAVAHRLAHATAAAVHRKRAPGLVLFVAPENADNGGEGSHG